jgi:hypothetical protein
LESAPKAIAPQLYVNPQTIQDIQNKLADLEREVSIIGKMSQEIHAKEENKQPYVRKESVPS